MKVLYSLALSIASLQACDPTDSNQAPEIKGVYVRQFEQEFGSGIDSVIIEPVPGVENGYVLRHHIQMNRMNSKGGFIPERKELVLPGTWDEQECVLVTNRLGRRYSFPKSEVLMLGTAKYERKLQD